MLQDGHFPKKEVDGCVFRKKNTPLKTNMFPENQWLEDVFPIEIVPF